MECDRNTSSLFDLKIHFSLPASKKEAKKENRFAKLFLKTEFLVQGFMFAWPVQANRFCAFLFVLSSLNWISKKRHLPFCKRQILWLLCVCNSLSFFCFWQKSPVILLREHSHRLSNRVIVGQKQLFHYLKSLLNKLFNLFLRMPSIQAHSSFDCGHNP